MDNSISMNPVLPASIPVKNAVGRQPAAAQPSASGDSPQAPTDSRSPDLALKELAQMDLEAALKRVSEQISEYSRQIGRSLEFQLQGHSDRVVILVTNKDSGELVRTIPLERVQRLPKKVAAGEPALVDLRA